MVSVIRSPAANFRASVSNESADEAKAHGDSLTRQGPVDFGTAQNPAGTVQPASLFSFLILMIVLAVLVWLCQSCMGQMRSLLEAPFFFSNILS